MWKVRVWNFFGDYFMIEFYPVFRKRWSGFLNVFLVTIILFSEFVILLSRVKLIASIESI